MANFFSIPNEREMSEPPAESITKKLVNIYKNINFLI